MSDCCGTSIDERVLKCNVVAVVGEVDLGDVTSRDPIAVND